MVQQGEPWFGVNLLVLWREPSSFFYYASSFLRPFCEIKAPGRSKNRAACLGKYYSKELKDTTVIFQHGEPRFGANLIALRKKQYSFSSFPPSSLSPFCEIKAPRRPKNRASCLGKYYSKELKDTAFMVLHGESRFVVCLEHCGGNSTVFLISPFLFEAFLWNKSPRRPKNWASRLGKYYSKELKDTVFMVQHGEPRFGA